MNQYTKIQWASQVEQRPEDTLQSLSRKYDTIYIDTCSLTMSNFELFFEHMLPYLQAYRKKLTIPYAVATELLKVAPARFVELMSMLRRYIPDYLELESESSGHLQSVADNYFLAKFTEMRLIKHQALVTQDRDLISEIKALRKSDCVKGIFRIGVFSINLDGFLDENRPATIYRTSLPTEGLMKPRSEAAAMPTLDLTQIPTGSGSTAPTTRPEPQLSEPRPETPPAGATGVCKECGEIFQITALELKATRPTRCPKCREEAKKTAICAECATPFKYRRASKDGRVLCPECRKKTDSMIVSEAECIVCRKPFGITYAESRTILPKRCPECRGKSPSSLAMSQGINLF